MMWRECIRKEWMESIKTARFWVIIAVFGVFGMLGPLTARYINEIISAVAGDLGGIIGQLPPPSVTDSWLQFFKNMNQMCMLVMVLMFMTMVSGEKRRGSVLLVLSKGVSRTTFLCAKLTAAVLVYTIAYALALGLHLSYTQLLFGEIGNSGIWIGLFCFWCYGISLLSLTLLTSTIARSTGVAAVLAMGGFLVIQGIALFSKLGAGGGPMGLIPTISLYSPGAANGLALLIYDGLKQAGDGWISAGVSAALAVILFIVADRIFRRQEL